MNTQENGSPDIQASPPWLSESVARTVQWFDNMKAENHILAKRVGLNTLKDWEMDREGFFSRRDGRFFRILGIDAATTGREIAAWRQPILANPKTGIIGILKRIHNGKRYYLMQAKAEVGNRITVQLAPTVQFTPGNYVENEKLPKPFLFEEFSGNSRFQLISESFQSEEGARFYREQHLHRVLMLPEGMEIDIPEDFRWLSEAEIQFFLQMGEHVNSCARSILACLL
jgi:oxidase EvaA